MTTSNPAKRQQIHYGNTEWLGSVSKPSRFTQSNVAYHRKLSSAGSVSAFSATATESCYIWNVADNISSLHNVYCG